MTLFKKDLFIAAALLIISACFFYYINLSVKSFNEWGTLKYTTPDSKTYLDVGKWLTGKIEFSEAQDSVAIRPFFYPLVVAISELIHPWAIIVFQFFLWQSQILLVYFFLAKMRISRKIVFLIALISISILSPVGISLHALTETLSSFFITFSVFSLSLYVHKKTHIYIISLLMTLSFCSVTRPSVLYLYIFSTIAIAFNLKSIKLFSIFIIATTTIPILIQVYTIKKHFDSYSLSFIDIITINNYFLSGLELYKNSIEMDVNRNMYIKIVRDARSRYIGEEIEKEGYREASRKIKKDIVRSLIQYPVESIKQFKDLVIENSVQSSSFLNTDKEMVNKIYFKITTAQSKMILAVNIMSTIFFLWIKIIIVTKSNKKNITFDGYNMFSLTVFFYIYFTYISTGVTFWQGDRFIVTIYYASVMLFVYQIQVLFLVIRNMKKRRNSQEIYYRYTHDTMKC